MTNVQSKRDQRTDSTAITTARCLYRIVLFILLPHLLFASSFYVSKSGNNSDGRSWSNAWNEMNQINWTNILPGDTIYLDGGLTEMVYTTPLTIGKSGVSVSPICIFLSKEAGRNGKATIFGGATLPYDNQPTYTGNMPAFNSGIIIGAYSWIIIDSTKWEGITIHGTGHDGIVLGAHSNDTTKEARDIVLRNIKIYDVGTPEQVDSTVLKLNSEYATLTYGYWHSKATATGIYFSYQAGARNVTIERFIISDISDEAIGEGPCRNLILRQSWLDNGRNCPDGKPFNYLNHPDGYQNYGWGGNQGPWLIEDCVIGPRFMQGLFPGAPTSDPNATETNVNNITVHNVLFLDNLSSNILGQMGHNWTFDHITSYVSSPTVGNNISMMKGVSVDTFTNSIIYGGNIYSINPTVFLDNVYYNTVGHNIHSDNSSNINVDPLFVNRSEYDLALQSGSPAAGKGSRVTSVAKLFELFPDLKYGFFQLSHDNYTVPDTIGKVTITVQRMSAMDGVVTVAYATADSTAIAGINYTSTTGTLSWADGDHADKSFDIPIIHSSANVNKVVKIALSNSTGGATIESPQSAILTITPVTLTGNSPGFFQLSHDNYTVPDTIGKVTISVQRMSAMDGVVTVVYATADSTAIAGINYTSATGTLSWADGDHTDKSFDIPIIHSSANVNKVVKIALSNPTGGATIVSPQSAILTITPITLTGNSPGSFQMSHDSYTVPDTIRKVTITVQRMSAMDGVVTVAYATADSTAIAGINYTSATGTLSWADGDHADKSFDILIIHSSASVNKVVKIVLSNPTGGATIEPPRSAILTITPVTLTGVGNLLRSIPDRYSLEQNYPNPFNPSSIISFDLPTQSFVSLKVFDALGREVATIVSEKMSAGSYTKQWDAENYPSGVYFCRLQAGDFVKTKKLVLLK